MPDWSLVDFDWDDGNVDHLLDRHGIPPEQAEQVFSNRPVVRRGRKVYTASGRDDDGNYLFLVFEFREGAVRVISARPMTTQERRSYVRHR
jgi:uncharacterized DUF497 family protein